MKILPVYTKLPFQCSSTFRDEELWNSNLDEIDESYSSYDEEEDITPQRSFNQLLDDTYGILALDKGIHYSNNCEIYNPDYDSAFKNIKDTSLIEDDIYDSCFIKNKNGALKFSGSLYNYLRKNEEFYPKDILLTVCQKAKLKREDGSEYLNDSLLDAGFTFAKIKTCNLTKLENFMNACVEKDKNGNEIYLPEVNAIFTAYDNHLNIRKRLDLIESGKIFDKSGNFIKFDESLMEGTTYGSLLRKHFEDAQKQALYHYVSISKKVNIPHRATGSTLYQACVLKGKESGFCPNIMEILKFYEKDKDFMDLSFLEKIMLINLSKLKLGDGEEYFNTEIFKTGARLLNTLSFDNCSGMKKFKKNISSLSANNLSFYKMGYIKQIIHAAVGKDKHGNEIFVKRALQKILPNNYAYNCYNPRVLCDEDFNKIIYSIEKQFAYDRNGNVKLVY